MDARGLPAGVLKGAEEGSARRAAPRGPPGPATEESARPFMAPVRRAARMPSPNPMDEENFPPNNPTRKSAEKHMNEPSNVRGSRDPVPKRLTTTEADKEGADAGQGGEDLSGGSREA